MFMQKYTYIYWIHTDAMITDTVINDARRKTQEDFFNKIFISRFIARVRKGGVGFYCERELKTEHNWNILTPKLWPSALCLSRSPGLLNRSPGVHNAGCWLSLLHLVSLCLQLYSPVLLLFNSSALYYLQPPTRWYGHASELPQFLPISGDRDVSLPLSLEWPVWSSSSENNCHAVQRSLSSGASVYESIMGFFFYLVPFHQPISAHATSSLNLECVTSLWCITLNGIFGQVKRSRHNNCNTMAHSNYWIFKNNRRLFYSYAKKFFISNCLPS